MERLLTRDDFREGVFKRDSYLCVICSKPGKDAHHIIERRLFSDGGYYMSNGATLCEEHHIKAEETTLSCEEIREAAEIDTIILPDHFYKYLDYDKWGNIILANEERIKGELFYDESVQKILGQGKVLDLFQKYIKYQRTYHLPWSNLLKDDRIMKDDSCFEGERVIVSLKMDGENTTWYNDFDHARSLNSGSREDRNWVKGLWAQKAWNLDNNMRICGENLFAKHTVHYSNLSSYFMVFSIWEDNTCLSWDETVEYCKILELETTPIIYDGIYDRKKIQDLFLKDGKEDLAEHKCLWSDKTGTTYNTNEGYVIRVAKSFDYRDFRKSIGKFVRPEFKYAVNNSHGHWASQKIVPNTLKDKI